MNPINEGFVLIFGLAAAMVICAYIGITRNTFWPMPVMIIAAFAVAFRLILLAQTGLSP